MDADNSNWELDQTKHWCLSGYRCPLRCDGDRDKALSSFVDAAQLSLGQRSAEPLEYRWKGVHEAGSLLRRGLKQHRLFPRACVKAFKPKEKKRTREGGRNGEGAAPNADVDNNDDTAASRQKRMRTTCALLELLDCVHQFDACQILTEPLYVYLLESYAAEKAVTLVHRQSELVAGSPTVESLSELDKLQRDAAKRIVM